MVKLYPFQFQELKEYCQSIDTIAREAKHPEYADLDARLVSFSSWSKSDIVKPKELVEAGFYFTGDSLHVLQKFTFSVVLGSNTLFINHLFLFVYVSIPIQQAKTTEYGVLPAMEAFATGMGGTCPGTNMHVGTATVHMSRSVNNIQ